MLEIYTDGASRGNPGDSGAGVVILENGIEIDTLSKFLGKKTNNEAEYLALLLALRWIENKNYFDKDIIFYADSQLMVKQMNGEYKVKAPTIIPLFREIKSLVNQCSSVKFSWLSRDKNNLADGLANQGIDNR